MSGPRRGGRAPLRAGLLLVLLVGGQLLTLGCGMANPALVSLFEGAGNGEVTSASVDTEHGHLDGRSMAGASRHGADARTGHADSHRALADGGSEGHHGDESGGADCLRSLSCSAVALSARVATSPSVNVVHEQGVSRLHVDGTSIDIPLHRPPPRRV